LPFENWHLPKLPVMVPLALAILGGALIQADLPVAVVVLTVDVAVLVVCLVAWTSWGRDPRVIDDGSVLAAGPPADLRPCLAAVLLDGRGVDRALKVALLQLAEWRLIEINDDPLVGNDAYIPRASIEVKAPVGLQRIDLGPPESILASTLLAEKNSQGRLDYVAVVAAIGLARPGFETAIDDELVAAGWYRRPPFRAGDDWLHRADDVLAWGIFGVVVAILTTSIPLLIAYVGLALAGWVSRRVAAAMPARTRAGAMIEAMLKAYRRSLAKTLATTESVHDVLRIRELAWFGTPDRMIVWAMALDLESDLAAMFARWATHSGSRLPDDVWFPDWYGTTIRDPQRVFRSLDHLVGSSAS
jgi:hypothetical protein